MSSEPPQRAPQGGLLGLLRDRWVWWVVPLVVMAVMTLILALAGQGTELAPVRYDVPTSAP